ncbi:MAG TPA: NAD(P) transhydrogenase subunit alpha [Gemmatimonadales bacterium]
MILAVLRESQEAERRVALTPDVVKRLVAQSIDVRIESGAGAAAGYDDAAYLGVGAAVEADKAKIFATADLVVSVQQPADAGVLRSGGAFLGVWQPLTNHALVRSFARGKVTSFSLDLLPRITRAQSMDVLSSQATAAGYKAVLLAAGQLPKFFPMLITAAGTIRPAKVLVLGAGVAGLQAIATAKRLGAQVDAFDVRPAVREQVESLGARFVAPEAVEAEGEGGYAREQTADQQERTVAFLHEQAKTADVIITTAQIPGRKAPTLITEAAVRDMPAGAVIVDLACETGGNCALTQAGATIERHGVTIIGPTNVAASMATHTSQMFAKNVLAFLGELLKDGAMKLDFDNAIISGTCITHDGNVVHERTRQAMEGGSGA